MTIQQVADNAAGGEVLGIVADYDPAARYGWIEFCETNGRIFYHRDKVRGKQPAPGSPVSFRIGWSVVKGRTLPRAEGVTRLCYANYGPGDGTSPDLYEQPIDDLYEQPSDDTDAAYQQGGELRGVVEK